MCCNSLVFPYIEIFVVTEFDLKTNLYMLSKCTNNDRLYYDFACGLACWRYVGVSARSNFWHKTLARARLRVATASGRPAAPGALPLTSMVRGASTPPWKEVALLDAMKHTSSTRTINAQSTPSTMWS